MVFSSVLFLYVFLPIFLLLYHVVGVRLQNYTILSFSILFYAWGAPEFIFLVLGSLIANFYIVRQIYFREQFRKVLLIISVCINVGLLAYFKYANFFVENINNAFSQLGLQTITWTKVILPIGISFFTFQSLTYTIDIYRGLHKPLDKLSDFLLYILMFPQLIAGPIIRFNSIADEIIARKNNDTLDYKLQGAFRFIIGLSKKVLIANVLGEQVDAIYKLPYEQVDTTLAWVAIIAYSFQIYFDFSGYSDMAIGLGKIMGFNFPENFNNPYISKSITEFWRRWHITLGAFMRDYLYIPLGGNRVKTKTRLYVNLGTVFLLSGLWHGSSWNFVLWGAWHGLFLILDRLFLEQLLNRLGKYLSVFITYIIVITGWLFFRIEEFDRAIVYLHKMYSFSFFETLYHFSVEFKVTLIVAFLFGFWCIFSRGQKVQDYLFGHNFSLKAYSISTIMYVGLLFICSAYITASGFNPFIYFRF